MMQVEDRILCSGGNAPHPSREAADVHVHSAVGDSFQPTLGGVVIQLSERTRIVDVGCRQRPGAVIDVWVAIRRVQITCSHPKWRRQMYLGGPVPVRQGP